MKKAMIGLLLVVFFTAQAAASIVGQVDKSQINISTNVTSTDDPLKLIDDIFYSGGVSKWTRRSSGAMVFDLGGEFYIDYANIIYTTTTDDEFVLSVSSDDTTYSPIGTIHIPDWGSLTPLGNFDCDINSSARYVKFEWGPVPGGYSGTTYEEVTFVTPEPTTMLLLLSLGGLALRRRK